ncbi:hypothetical protein CERSUDRAFT_91925 [Gelatoporia subvermispora B]|uniref:C2H2-type domain-containing protein n=1 Tax=Ceriporiopsis subvermispora (strain B) TaxID=914234 RepID=M2R9R3_CERS8|nr:hypothetical protein CERSUDRAFT_91925 [Gelatoporia subvermispora B]
MPDERDRVTLPSINEMFPEHLLGGMSPQEPRPPRALYAEYASPAMAPRRSPARYSPAFQEHRLDPDAIMYEGTPPPSDRRATTEAAASQLTLPSYGAGQPRYTSSPRTAHAHQVAPLPPFSFARAQPLTARLENVSVSAAPGPTRAAHMLPAGFAEPAMRAPPLDAITKARPAFRVHLPGPGPADADAPARAMSVDPYDAPAVPPSRTANAYLSRGGPAAAHAAARGSSEEQPGAEGAADEKRHRCPHCSKRFNRPSSLNIHVNTHTGAKPFMCRFPGCNRQFNVNSNMRRHYRNHLTSRRRDVVARFLQPHGRAPPDEHAPPPGARGAAPYSPRSPSTSPGGSPAPAPCRLEPGRSAHYRAELYAPGACAVPGCACAAPRISPTLRPAFPESMPGGAGRAGS